MQRVYYWDGILDPRSLADNYEKTLQQLILGEYRAVNLEKLRGHNVYSARINHTHRLLFNTVVINGKSFLMVLDVVLNHDYHKSPALKPAVLKKYLQLNGHLLKQEEMTEEAFEAVDELDSELADCTTFKYETAECYQQKFIELSDDQNSIVRTLELPMFVTGAAGSGKSCVAMSMLSHYAAKHLGSLSKPILYVTESENLCNTMRRNWEELPLSARDTGNKVQFKTYAQLLEENDPNFDKERLVGKAKFIIFIEQRIRHQKQLDKSARVKGLSTAFFENKDTMYQEMRTISGCTSWEDYQAISKRQALITDDQERKWLFAAYQDYKEFLAHENWFDLALYQPEIKDAFQLIVVDETQDLSPAQIAVLRKLAVNEQICFCEDARQSLTDIKSKQTFIGQLLDARNDKITFRELKQSYRCPAAAVKMATVMSNLGATLTGQKPQAAAETINEHPGEVTWLNNLDEATLQSLRTQAETPDFAVITTKNNKEAAKKIFGTELVFTVDEIKGLEYRKILAYRLMDEEIYFEASAQLQQSVKSVGTEKFGPACNALYTACTRCTEALIIVQDNPKTAHRLRNLVTHCQEHGLPKVALPTQNKPSVEISTQRKQELWFEEVKRQLNNGNVDLAKRIYLNDLGKTEDEFNQLITVDYPADGKAPTAAVPAKSKKKKKKKKSAAAATLAESHSKIAEEIFALSTTEQGNVELYKLMSIDQKAKAIHANLLIQKFQSGNELKSTFDNLYATDLGISILIKMITTNNSLTEAISVNMLIDISAYTKDGLLINPSILLSDARKKLFSLLESINSKKYENLIDKFMVQYKTKSEKNKIPPNYQAFAYVDKLLKNPTPDNLVKLVTHKNSARYLFQMPIETQDGKLIKGECLYTLLFDLPRTRVLWLDTLHDQYLPELFAGLTANALCRVHPDAEDMPPIFWLAGYAEYAMAVTRMLDGVRDITSGFKESSLFREMAFHEYQKQLADAKKCTTLYGSTYRIKPATLASVSTLFLLLLNCSSYNSLISFMTPNIAKRITHEMLILECIELLNENKCISLYDLIRERPHGQELLRIVMATDGQAFRDGAQFNSMPVAIPAPVQPQTGIRSGDKIIDPNTTPEAIYALLENGKNASGLVNLFARKDLHIILFQEMPGHGNDCLFTLLCDIKEYQHFLLGALFIENLDKIAPYFTDAALVGKNIMNRLLHFKMPPIYWMARNESTMIAIEQQKTSHMMDALKKAIGAYPHVLEQPIQTGKAVTNTNTLFWLASHEAGNVVLHHLLESSPKICEAIHAPFLTQPYQVGQFTTSVFDHLYLSDIGTYILTQMVTANRALAEAFTVDLLADLNIANNDGSLIQPDSLMSPARMGLYKVLMDINPEKFKNIAEAIIQKYNEKVKKATPAPQNRTRDYVQGLMRNPSLENLEALIKHKNSGLYLFQTKIVSEANKSVDGECLYTILFDTPSSRLILLDNLHAKYELEICSNLTASAICRVNPDVPAMPPLFWLAGYTTYSVPITRLLDRHAFFGATFNTSTLARQMSVEQYQLSLAGSQHCTTLHGDKHRLKLSAFPNISTMFLLLLNCETYDSLTNIINESFASCITKEMLTVESVVLPEENKTISLLDLILTRTYGPELFTSILLYNDGLRKSFTDEIIRGSDVKNGDFIGSCLAYDLPKTPIGRKLLSKLIAIDRCEEVAMLAFNGFQKHLPDDAQSLKYLIDICKSEEGITALGGYLYQRTAVFEKMDPDLFAEPCPYPANSNKALLIKTMKSTNKGKEFFTGIKKARPLFCEDQPMSDAAASRAGAQHRLLPPPSEPAKIEKPRKKTNSKK